MQQARKEIHIGNITAIRINTYWCKYSYNFDLDRTHQIKGEFEGKPNDGGFKIYEGKKHVFSSEK